MLLNMTNAVYVAMCADPLHHGHINVIEYARHVHRSGQVVIGLLTDKAIASYKQPPVIKYEDRLRVVKSLEGLYGIVAQDTLDYVPNLKKYKPRYVVHGGRVQESVRDGIIEALRSWGGELIEIAYTEGISSTKMRDAIASNGVMPEDREKKLRRLISLKPIVRVMEAHNGLSGLIVGQMRYDDGGKVKEFDAIWESSLTDSASKGKPDTELVDFTSRLQTVEQILEVTTKPLIVDGNTGGHQDHFAYAVRTLERLGVSAVIIEDKIFPKQNSLLDEGIHAQVSKELFSLKIKAGKNAQVTNEFMVIARIESLIAGETLENAIVRAEAYIEAGADGIMIHSKKKDPAEILEFCQEYHKRGMKAPLVVVPTTYNTITESELIDAGVSVVIYANHLLRSSYLAMRNVARRVLEAGQASVAEPFCIPIPELFRAVK